MRIIAGEWRGRPLEAPPGMQTRPTSDRAREGLFSMLASRLGTFEDLTVADLFAGSGALGLEALSRGAARCLFIDRDAGAAATIRRNGERLGASDRIEIRIQQLEHARPPALPCDLLFLDPPYGSGLAEQALARIGAPGWLAAGAMVSLETDDPRLPVPAALSLETTRRFGKAHIVLLRRG
jgi:16S rRNA (guanine966-N2)-methyltransferase